MRPFKILILGNLLSSSVGTRSVGEELAVRLRKAQWTVTTASPRKERVIRALDMLFAILKHRDHYNIAYLEVYSGLAFVWAELNLCLLKILRKPVVLTLHGGDLPKFARQSTRRTKRLLQAGDVVTTPSRYIQTALFEVRGDILLLPNAIELASYQFCHRPQPMPKVAWLRAFHEIYAPTLAAEALSLLVDEFPEVELTMFGPDKGDGSLQAMRLLAQQAGVSERIKTPGPIPKSEVPEHLARYYVFLNTTTVESFGVSVVEAAALGMCLVTTNVGELPYIWTHEHDALLVPPNDPKAMAAAVRRILIEPGLAARLSRNARATAAQFDWSVILSQWEALLTAVIER